MTNSAKWWEVLREKGKSAGDYFILDSIDSIVELTSELEIPKGKTLIIEKYPTPDDPPNQRQGGLVIKSNAKLTNKGTIYIPNTGRIGGESDTFVIELGGILDNYGKIYSYTKINNHGKIHNHGVISCVTRTKSGAEKQEKPAALRKRTQTDGRYHATSDESPFGPIGENPWADREPEEYVEPPTRTGSGAITNSGSGKIFNKASGIIKDRDLSKNVNNNDPSIDNKGTIYSPDLWYVPLMEGLGYDSSKYELSEDGNTFTIKAGEYTEINKDFPGTLELEPWMSRKRPVSNNYLTLLSGFTVPRGKTVVNHGTIRNLYDALYKDPGESKFESWTEEQSKEWANITNSLRDTLVNMMNGKMLVEMDPITHQAYNLRNLYNITINNGGIFKNHGVIYRFPGNLYLGEDPTAEEQKDVQAIEDRVDKKTPDSLSRIQADELLKKVKEARFENIGGTVYDSFREITFRAEGKLINQRRDKVNAVFKMGTKLAIIPGWEPYWLQDSGYLPEISFYPRPPSSAPEIINGINEIGNNDLFAGPHTCDINMFFGGSIKNYGIFGAKDPSMRLRLVRMFDNNCKFYNNRLAYFSTPPAGKRGFENLGTFINDVRGKIHFSPEGVEGRLGPMILNRNMFKNYGTIVMMTGSGSSSDAEEFGFRNWAGKFEAVFENHGKFILETIENYGQFDTNAGVIENKSTFGPGGGTFGAVMVKTLAKIINTGKVYTGNRSRNGMSKMKYVAGPPDYFINKGGELLNYGIWQIPFFKNGGIVYSNSPIWSESKQQKDDNGRPSYTRVDLDMGIDYGTIKDSTQFAVKDGGYYYTSAGYGGTGGFGGLGYKWPDEAGYPDPELPGYKIYNVGENRTKGYQTGIYSFQQEHEMILYRVGVTKYWYSDLMDNGIASVPWTTEKDSLSFSNLYLDALASNEKIPQEGFKLTSSKTLEKPLDIYTGGKLVISKDTILILKKPSTNNGSIYIEHGGKLTLKTSLTNNGTIYVKSGGVLLADDGGATITNNKGATIYKVGDITISNGASPIVNNGTISESGPTEPTDAEESGGQPTIEFPELTNCDYHKESKSYNLDNEKFQHKITMENGVSSTETVVKISSKFFANLIKYFFTKAKETENKSLSETIDNELGNMCFWNSIDIGYGNITKCDISTWIASGTDTENLYKDTEYMMDNQATIKFPIKLFQEMIDYLQKNPGECGDVDGADEFYTSLDCIQLGCKEKVDPGVARGGSLGGLRLFPDYTALKAWVLFSEKQDEVRGKISGFLTDKYTKEDNVPIKVLIYGAVDDGSGFGLVEFTSTITPLENDKDNNYRFKWEVYKKDGEKYGEVTYSTKHDNGNIVVANLTEKGVDAGWHVTYYPDENKKLVPEGKAHLVMLGRAYNTPIWFYKTDDKIEIMFAERDQYGEKKVIESTDPKRGLPEGQIAAPYPVMEGRHTDGTRGFDTIYLYVPQAEITKICKLNNIPY